MRYASQEVQRAQQRQLLSPFKIPQTIPKKEKLCEAKDHDAQACGQHRVDQEAGHHVHCIDPGRWYRVSRTICDERRHNVHHAVGSDLEEFPDKLNQHGKGPEGGPHKVGHVMLHERPEGTDPTRNQ